MKRVLKTATWLIPFCKHVNLKQRGKERQVIVISDWKKKSISKLFLQTQALKNWKRKMNMLLIIKRANLS
jgi:hypothetical protein